MHRCYYKQCSRCRDLVSMCNYGKNGFCTSCQTSDLVSCIIALDILPEAFWHIIFEYSYCRVCANLKCLCNLRKCLPITETSVGLVPIIAAPSRQ